MSQQPVSPTSQVVPFPHANDGSGALPSTLAELDVRMLVRMVWRQRWLLLGSMLVCLLLAALWLVMQPSQYTSRALIQVLPPQAPVMENGESLFNQVTNEATVVRSHMDILTSPAVASRVVDTLNIVRSPEYAAFTQPQSALGQIKQWLKGGEPTAEALHAVATQEVLRRLRVSNPPRSLTIYVSMRAQSSAQSAALANAVAEAYLALQLENRITESQRANVWLKERLVSLGAQVKASEAAVQSYRDEFGLIEKQGLTMTDQQVSELNKQLILIRTERAEAQAKLRNAQQLMQQPGGVESAAEVLKSPLIQKLREQEAEVVREEAEMASRYGEKHPQMIKKRAEMRDLRAKIRQEVDKIIVGLQNDVAIARTREESLSSNLDQAQAQVGSASAAEVGLAELERERDANRALYQALLARSKETSAEQQFDYAETRLVSPATPPLAPSHPQKKIVLAGAGMMGLLLGLVLLGVIERLDGSFRTLEQVERLTGLTGLGMVPQLPADAQIMTYLDQHPTAAYVESLRTLRTTAAITAGVAGPMALMVTSGTAEEGKSVLTIGLGLVAKQAGQKVLLIEADMRRPTLSKNLQVRDGGTLNQVLLGEQGWQQAVQRHGTGMDVLRAQANTDLSNTLLTSKAWDQLIEEAKQQYDLVLIDVPPVAPIVDALTAARAADGVLFVVKWGATSRELVKLALKQLRLQRIAVTGVVLNQVDMRKDTAYGYGYGGYTDKYYQS